MGKKNNTKNEVNNLPFSNEVKKAKSEFKKMIDEMPDEEFIDFSLLFMGFVDQFDDEFDEDFDEEFDDE